MFLLLNLAVVLTAAGMRFAGPGLRYATPVRALARAWWLATAAVAAGVLAAWVLGRAALRRQRTRRALAELAFVFPACFAYEWAVLPALVEDRRWWDWAVLAALAAAVVALLWHDRGRRDEAGLTRGTFLPAARLLAVPTAALVAVPIVLACFVGTDFAPGRFAASLAYPLYAAAQLLVFQSFLVPRLRRLGASRPAVIAVGAGLFALFHWPNGLVMAACAAGAAVWTWAFLRRPSLPAVALSMGLAAIAFSNALPRGTGPWGTHNLRTGPIYVRRLLEGAACHGAAGGEAGRAEDRGQRSARRGPAPSCAAGGRRRRMHAVLTCSW